MRGARGRSASPRFPGVEWLTGALIFLVAALIGAQLAKLNAPQPPCSTLTWTVYQINHERDGLLMPTIGSSGSNPAVVMVNVESCRFERVGPGEYHFIGNERTLALGDVVAVIPQ